jgi:hypothetical protein
LLRYSTAQRRRRRTPPWWLHPFTPVV